MRAHIQKIFTILIITMNLFSMTSRATNQLEMQSMLDSVDKTHQKFTHEFYRDLLKKPAYKNDKYASMSSLLKQLNSAQEIKNIALIVNNIDMIKAYYDDPIIFIFIKQLLEMNAYNAAKDLINEVLKQGDSSSAIHANFLLADFYFQRRQWKKTLQKLSTDINFLDNSQYHYALLMKGISYQKINEHLQASKAYEKIPINSGYYNSSQLNLALANLRQGWWTDGHIIIEQQLKKQKKKPHETTLNRLYITLAYSLLNQGYYRSARSTFHQIGIESQYANQAILGIALTAAQQDDDIGALNATRYLKKQKQDELAVHESHLLMPFFYEKSNQLVAASSGYNQATEYYKKEIAKLQNIINAPLDLSQYAINESNYLTVSFANTTIDFKPEYPVYYFKSRAMLEKYRPYIKHSTSQNKYNELTEIYQQSTSKMGKEILRTRVDNLTSYLNQSRYGLARLFDNNTAEQ